MLFSLSFFLFCSHTLSQSLASSFPLNSGLMKTTLPWHTQESVTGDTAKSFTRIACMQKWSHLLHHRFHHQVITDLPLQPCGLSPCLLWASCITAVFHRIFSVSFRNRQFSRALFPIKIPFHKTAFSNSWSGLKTSVLSSLFHCIHSFPSWSTRAELICDHFHPDRLPPATAFQPVFPH